MASLNRRNPCIKSFNLDNILHLFSFKMLTSSVLAVTLASVAGAKQPAKTVANIFVDIAPLPTAPALQRRGPDYECVSSVATQIAPVTSVDAALSSYVEEHSFDLSFASSCTVTLPDSLTSDYESVYSAFSTWAGTISSKAAGIHTDCGNGSPITLGLLWKCTDNVEIVGTADGEKPKTTTLPGLDGPSRVVIGSAGTRTVVSWGALAAALGAAALL